VGSDSSLLFQYDAPLWIYSIPQCYDTNSSNVVEKPGICTVLL